MNTTHVYRPLSILAQKKKQLQTRSSQLFGFCCRRRRACGLSCGRDAVRSFGRWQITARLHLLLCLELFELFELARIARLGNVHVTLLNERVQM